MGQLLRNSGGHDIFDGFDAAFRIYSAFGSLILAQMLKVELFSTD